MDDFPGCSTIMKDVILQWPPVTRKARTGESHQVSSTIKLKVKPVSLA